MLFFHKYYDVVVIILNDDKSWYVKSDQIWLVYTCNSFLNFSANGIVAVNADSFYFTNTFHSLGDLSKMMEFIMMFSWGTLVYYDGTTEHAKVMARAFGPNGLAISPNKR